MYSSVYPTVARAQKPKIPAVAFKTKWEHSVTNCIMTSADGCHHVYSVSTNYWITPSNNTSTRKIC